ncbi:unnamed protein product [Closterium sp. NIES-54]
MCPNLARKVVPHSFHVRIVAVPKIKAAQGVTGVEVPSFARAIPAKVPSVCSIVAATPTMVPVTGVDIFALDYDTILTSMYALSVSVEGDCYRGVPPDPGIAAAALGASESGTLPGTTPTAALHTFTLDSDAYACFFRDSTTLTPLSASVPVRLADPSGGPAVARSSTVLPCLAVPSGSLSGLHLPSFSANLVSTAALQDAIVTTTTHGGQRVSICTCTWTGRHLAMFTRRPGSSLYTLATEPPQVAASGQVAASCSCRLLSHQTLLWHHRLGHPSLPRLRGMHSRILVSGLPRSVPPLPPSSAPPCLPYVEGRQRPAPHSSSFPPTIAPLQTLHIDRFGQDLPVLHLHSDRGGEFSSNLCGTFVMGRAFSSLMEIARTSMIHAAAPHFLWSFATSPTLRWMGEVGDASMFWVWGSRAFVRDTSADQLSPRAIPCVFLGFVLDALGWQFYHPTSRRVFPSPDVTFDKSVPICCLFPYRSAPPPPPPLFLAPGPPPVAVDSGAARGAASPGAASGSMEPGGAEFEGAETGGVEAGGGEPGGAEPEGVEPGGAALKGAESGGAEPHGAASFGGSAGASPRLSLQQLREWLVWRVGLWSGATGAGGVGAAGAGVTGGTATTGPGGARLWGTGAAAIGGVEGAGAGDPTESGATGAGGFGAGGAGAGGAEVGLIGGGGAGVGGPGDGGAGAGGAGAVDPGGAVQPRPYFVPLLQQPASPPVSPVCTARRVPHSRPPPVPGTHAMTLRPSSIPLRVPLPALPESSLPEVPDPESYRAHAASPTVSRLLTTAVTDPSFESAAASALVAELLDFAAAYCLDYTTALVVESASASPPSVRGECALGTDVLEDRKEEFQSLAAAAPRFASMLLALEGDPDAPDIPIPRSYAEAITGPYSSQWQAAMDAEMASWKSTGTYIDEVPPPAANIVDGMWIFRVKRPPSSPPAFKARYSAQGFSQRQGVDYFQTFSPTPKMTTLWVFLHITAQHDYELHSLDFSTAFQQGSLHEEIWLCRPPGFNGSFPAGTQWSLRRPVHGPRQAPHEWHDTQRATLASLGFAPSAADPSLFLRTDTSLPPLYVLVHVDDLVFATAHTEALTLVLQRFGFQFSLPQPTPLSTSHSLSAPPLDESIEPSGPYPELVGCLMYLMTWTRPDLAYLLRLLARYVASGRHQKVHWDAAKRVLRYMCSTSGMGLVLGGQGLVVLTGHADASWVDDSATQRLS